MAIVDGHIKCSRCRLLKPVSEYAPSAVKNGCGNCRACQQLYTSAYQKANPEKSRAYGRASYRRNLETARARGRKKQNARRAAQPEATKEYQRRYYRAAPPAVKAKMAASSASWRARNPERVRARDLAKYGLTPAEYDRILATQGGGCACCGSKKNKSGRRMFVDHDHSTGAVRGLLCHHCNAGIGHLGDTLEGVKRAVAYLERVQQQLPTRAAPTMRINLLGAN